MDKTGLDGVTVNSLINSVTWLSADQALDLGFIDQVEDYSAEITNKTLIRNYVDSAPVFYKRCINKILTNKSNMNTENKELIERTTSVLDKIMNFFKKVVNKQTITDKGILHHAGELDEGTEVYNDEDMSSPAASDCYTTASGSKIAVQGGKVQQVTPPADPDAEPDNDQDAYDDDDTMPSDKLKSKKPMDVQNRLQHIKAKLHAQNALLAEAREALEVASLRLKKTREEVKNEIKSDFTPPAGGSKRSAKAKSEPVPFFAPQTPLAQNAVRRAVAK